MPDHARSLMLMPAARRSLVALILPALFALSSCSAPTGYMGISFTGRAPDPAVPSLAQRAWTGDKQAQLELGIRFEEGIGVPPDIKRARKLYRRAATTTGGTIFVYIPPATRGGRGSVAPVNTGPIMRGLDEARKRLAALDGISPEIAMRRRLDYLIYCLRTTSRCDFAASLAVFRSALPSISDDVLRQRLADFVATRRNRVTILSIKRRDKDHYDAEINYSRGTAPACAPENGRATRDLLCPKDPSAPPYRETWRITVREDDSLDIAVGRTEQVAMGGGRITRHVATPPRAPTRG